MRKWLVRGLVFSVVAAASAAAWLYQHWTNPTAVRQQVLAKLGGYFNGANISLDSAHMRLLGGIALSELRLGRRDEAEKADFLYVPAAVIYPDKEHVRDGKLGINKIDLNRPRLRVLRLADGRWNLQGITPAPQPDKPIPTIVIQQGTLLLEDRRTFPGAPPLEIRDVQLTVVNDPIPLVTFKGTGVTDLAGTVQIKGTWQRLTGDISLALEAPGVKLGPPLVQRLASYVPQAAAHAHQLEGQAKLHAELGYHPGLPQPWAYEVRGELHEGKFQHAQLPLPLERMEASLRYANGQVTEGSLHARCGPTELSVTVKDFVPGSEGSFEDQLKDFDLEAKHLAVTEALFASLPQSLKDIQHDFQPNGTVTLGYHLRHESHGQWSKHSVVEPEDLSICFVQFPYLLEHITGKLEQVTTGARENMLKIKLVGKADAQPVSIEGEIRGEKPNAHVEIDIEGKDIAMTPRLEAALPSEKYRKLARSFDPTGRGDIRVFIRRTPGAEKFSNRFLVDFHETSIRYQVFPYPIEHVSGTLDVQPDHWEVRGFRGTHKGGEFAAEGRSYPTPEGDVTIRIGGNNILLDAELQAALQPELRGTWAHFAPTGRINFQGTVGLQLGVADRPPQIDLTVSPRGCAIKADFFPYLLDDLRGQLHYVNGVADLEQFRARHGDTVLSLAHGTVRLYPGGGMRADLTDIEGNPILPDAEFLDALPRPLRSGLAALHLKDPLALKTDLVIQTPTEPGGRPDVYWNGAVAVRDATIDAGVTMEHVSGEIACRGRHSGQGLEGVLGNLLIRNATLFKNQALRNVQGQLVITNDEPESLQLPGLHAEFLGGELYGPVRVTWAGPAVAYELDLTGSQIKLEEFGRQSLEGNSQMSGTAGARVHLEGQGSDLTTLTGKGAIKVHDGKMGSLPLLLDLLKFLGLRLPDRTAFEDAEADFTVIGPRVRMDRIDLYGNAISLRGRGEMNLNGSDINMDFNVDWARLTQVLSPAMRKLPQAISNQLLKIHMRGKIGDVKLSQEPVPLLVEPLKKVFGGKKESQPQAAARPQ